MNCTLRLSLCSLALTLLSPALLAQQTPAIPSATSSDDAIARIKDEGLNRSQVMQTLSYLSDVIGPRLTASPAMKRANEWTRDTLSEWGLQNTRLESWGPFGKGWTLERFSSQVVAPQDIPLIAYPLAWSPGFKGPKVADLVYVDAKTPADLEKYRGRLKGAIVMTAPPREIKPHFELQGTRYTDAALAEMESATPAGPRPGRRGGAGRFQLTPEQQAAAQFANAEEKFFLEEGVAAEYSAARGDDGTIFVQSARVPVDPDVPREKRPHPWDKNAPRIVPQVAVSAEQYNRMVRMMQQGEKLKVAMELTVRFTDQDLMGYNTTGEIPGSDLKDEIVMLGGHMDSWHAGTGATDNGAGVAVCMEAVRILKALKLQPRRTIRIALWSGEEEGLFGSQAYVAQHFGTYAASPAAGGASASGATGTTPAAPRVLTRRPEYDKLSGYFNLDNGTGKIRGVYLQGNEAMRPIFAEWLAPFKEMGAATLTIRNTGSTDHVSYDGIGLPGFQFIQDEIEYSARTHHSNQDVYDRIQADDMKQAAVIMAAFVYDAAMRDEKLPRKPLAP